ncbi:acyl-CoA dehydrogenase family protein [Caldibacillus debilis]|uniref:Butyryl-CoA dehydrogenase n=1 Tax=Caldibacillus debilis TaxID=301148 RepID=A0A150LBB2_9BACI|nr:acyl-CoA dehydrogenase family protein [Caldibacillus debilis]KYD09022.1 Butyryl-CoA dehydrogenase [Caldibacillus debilis]
MISFQPTEEQRAFAEMAKQVAVERIRPQAKAFEKAGQIPGSFIAELEELGFLAMELPAEWHGLELPLATQSLIWKGLAYGDLAVAQSLPGAGDAASVLRFLPDLEKLRRVKEQFVAGKGKTIAFIDGGSGPEYPGSPLRLEKRGKGYLLDGRSAPVRLAAFSDFLMVAAADASGEELLLFLEEGDSWEAEGGNGRLGLSTAGIASVVFREAEIGEGQILAKGREARELLEKARTRIRILEAAKETGLMEAALDYATAYTAERKAFGQEIAKFQGVSFRIADMAIELRAAELLVLESAMKAEEDPARGQSLANRALSRAHRALRYITDSAVQLLGGHGYIQEYPAEKWMRDAQAQVMLYGRERELLSERGEHLIAGDKGVAVS